MSDDTEPKFDTSWDWHGFHPFQLPQWVEPPPPAPTNWNVFRSSVSAEDKERIANIIKWHTSIIDVDEEE